MLLNMEGPPERDGDCGPTRRNIRRNSLHSAHLDSFDLLCVVNSVVHGGVFDFKNDSRRHFLPSWNPFSGDARAHPQARGRKGPSAHARGVLSGGRHIEIDWKESLRLAFRTELRACLWIHWRITASMLFQTYIYNLGCILFKSLKHNFH